MVECSALKQNIIINYLKISLGFQLRFKWIAVLIFMCKIVEERLTVFLLFNLIICLLSGLLVDSGEIILGKTP